MQGNGEVLVGVDVSKAWIDVCRSGSRHVERVANTPDGLAAWVGQARPTLVAMEPTGGYERALCSALAEAGIRYVKLHPNTILAFRKARGLRAKTDRIDAMLIAHYLADAVRRVDLPATFRADERLRALAARQAEGCRADLASDPVIRESLATVVAALTQSRIASPKLCAGCAAAVQSWPRRWSPTCRSSAVYPENRSQPSSDSPPILTKAEKRAGKPKPAMEERWCAARCSTPPEPPFDILPRCKTSTIASSKQIIAPEKSP
jgi:Transposase